MNILNIHSVWMACNPNPTSFLDTKRILIRNLNCEFGLLIFSTFVAINKKIFSQYISHAYFRPVG